jgi:hypothetical protein
MMPLTLLPLLLTLIIDIDAIDIDDAAISLTLR